VCSSLSSELKDKVEDLARLISEPAFIRGPALYGYEMEDIPISQAFSLECAKEVFDNFDKVEGSCFIHRNYSR